MQQGGVDLRRFPRIKSDIRVRAFIPPDSPASDSFGRGYDISEGGMAIYVGMELAPQQEVLVVFDVPPSRQKLGLRGVVRYARGYRYGVEFQRLDDRDRSELRKALNDLAVIQDPQRT
ncbi:MAG: PilZ domain-containing protein [Acidobacteriia bacterium]|nr:PilZ domain-containing protein [Terriglobia bacterium]